MNRSITFSLWQFVCLAAVVFVASPPACAQSGLRESLEKLDVNHDGVIDPKEITPLARPYLEQIARVGSSSSRLRLDRPNKVSAIQAASRSYHASRSGAVAQRDVKVGGKESLLPFGPQTGETFVPEFGLAEVRFPYTQADLDFVARTMSTHDENKDGFIDWDEASRHKWTHLNPFEDDLNEDGRLSRMEMAQRYARRRLLDRTASELRRKAGRTGSLLGPAEQQQKQRVDKSMWWRQGGSDYWLTAALMGRFDQNKDTYLDSREVEEVGIPMIRIDTDRDGRATRDELFAYVKAVQDDAGGSDTGPPDWFFELDANHDDQVAMNEFADEWTDGKIDEFTSLDGNGDGLLTVAEVNRSPVSLRGSYRNDDVQLLPPKKTIVSEIEISDDYLISDLNIQISLSHSSTGMLDGYLTGPQGQRIELFTALGGSGDNFDDTIFDDQAPESISKAASPFGGTYSPAALSKRQPGLSHFNDQSVKGVWQLVIRGARSSRFGMLHSWQMMVQSSEETTEPEPQEETGPSSSPTATNAD